MEIMVNIRDILHPKIRKVIKIVYFKLIFFRYILDDYIHLLSFYHDQRENRLLSNITREYHRLEKGLSHKYFRIGFGERALNELVLNLNKYFISGFNKEHSRVKTALSVLNQYILRHKKSTIDLASIKDTLKKYSFYDNSIANDLCELGGVNSYSKKHILKMSNSNFTNLSKSRHSVRFFDSSEVLLEEVLDAISIAQKAPSVCNRQGWFVRVIKSESIINTFRKVHNGFSSESQNLNCLILVSFRKDYFSYPLERNQGYTDSGLFSMSLLFALTSKGLATCPLNANLTRNNEKKIRSVLEINKDEGLVMFIAVGHYEDTFYSPKSHRDDIDDVVKIFH
jgi:nitroreductase